MTDWVGTPIDQDVEIGYCSTADVINVLTEQSTELNLTQESLQHAVYAASRLIEDKTQQYFYTYAVTGEIAHAAYKHYLKLSKPIIAIQKLEYWDGATEAWIEITGGTEDFTGDYYVEDKDLAKVYTKYIAPRYRINYTWGHAVTPGIVKYLCSYLAAHNTLITKVATTQSETQTKARDIALKAIKAMIDEYGSKLVKNYHGAFFL